MHNQQVTLCLLMDFASTHWCIAHHIKAECAERCIVFLHKAVVFPPVGSGINHFQFGCDRNIYFDVGRFAPYFIQKNQCNPDPNNKEPFWYSGDRNARLPLLACPYGYHPDGEFETGCSRQR